MQATRGTPVADRLGGAVRRRTRSLAVTAAVVLVADIVSKVAIVATLAPQQHVHVVGDLLEITETRNGGAAFSIGPGATVLFTAVAVIVVGVIVREARRLASRGWAVTLGLLLGGALGNLVDRLFRSPAPLRGHVVDWIQLPHWPVFNIADSAIVIGGCLAILLATRGVTLDGQRPDTPDAPDAPEAPEAPDEPRISDDDGGTA